MLWYYDTIFYLQHSWKIIWHSSPMFIICLGSFSLSSYTSSCRMGFRIKFWSQCGCVITLHRREMLFENTREALAGQASYPDWSFWSEKPAERAFLMQVLLFPSDPIPWTWHTSGTRMSLPNAGGTFLLLHEGHTKPFHPAAFSLFLEAFRPKFTLPSPRQHKVPTWGESGRDQITSWNQSFPSQNPWLQQPWDDKCSAKGHRATRDVPFGAVPASLCPAPHCIFSSALLIFDLFLLFTISCFIPEPPCPIPRAFCVQLKDENTPKTSGSYTVPSKLCAVFSWTRFSCIKRFLHIFSAIQRWNSWLLYQHPFHSLFVLCFPPCVPPGGGGKLFWGFVFPGSTCIMLPSFFFGRYLR